MNCIKSHFSIAKFNHLKDYYAQLGISKTNDQNVIKQAYYGMAKKYHPDLNKGREDKFKEISEAYEVLSDENTKRDYDNMRMPNSNTNSDFHRDPRKNHANQQQQSYRPNQNYNQNWNTRSAYDQAFRQATQNFYYQTQQQQYQQKKNDYSEQIRRAERVNYEEMIHQQILRQKRDEEAKRQYYEQEKRRNQQFHQKEREAYEEYLRQKEYEQYQQEKFEEYQYKAKNLDESLENIQKNWNSIKSNVSNLWNQIKGKKD